MGLRRREFAWGGLAALVACRRRKAEGFAGYAFVANSAGRAVAVVDLNAFAAIRHIRLESDPVQLIAHPRRPSVYCLTPAGGALCEIDASTLKLARTARVGGHPDAMLLSPDGDRIWLLERSAGTLQSVPTSTLNPGRPVKLPALPFGFDISPDGATLAIGFGAAGFFLMPAAAPAPPPLTPLDGSADLLRFRSDSRQLLVGNQTRRTLSVIDSASSRLVVHLPLPVRPEHFCFKPDGGQLFITGEGMDAVVTVHPYQTQIASSTLAGGSPGYMAAARDPDYLFVTNPLSGDVSVIDITTQRLLAVVTVGREPRFVTITPDNRYALVLNRESGDMAVIRIETLTGRRRKLAPLFLLAPVGSRPVCAVVRPA